MADISISEDNPVAPKMQFHDVDSQGLDVDNVVLELTCAHGSFKTVCNKDLDCCLLAHGVSITALKSDSIAYLADVDWNSVCSGANSVSVRLQHKDVVIDEMLHVYVKAVNDAPVMHVPSTVAGVVEDVVVAVSGVSVVDVDAGATFTGLVDVEVKASHGKVFLTNCGGLDLGKAAVCRQCGTSLTARGYIDNVNTALKSLRYVSAKNWNSALEHTAALHRVRLTTADPPPTYVIRSGHAYRRWLVHAQG